MATVAVKRNGDMLRINDRVTTDFHRKCEGRVFVICEMNEYAACESGVMIVTHLENEPDTKMTGSSGIGIDSNWFTKIE